MSSLVSERSTREPNCLSSACQPGAPHMSTTACQTLLLHTTSGRPCPASSFKPGRVNRQVTSPGTSPSRSSFVTTKVPPPSSGTITCCFQSAVVFATTTTPTKTRHAYSIHLAHLIPGLFCGQRRLDQLISYTQRQSSHNCNFHCVYFTDATLGFSYVGLSMSRLEFARTDCGGDRLSRR